MKDNYILYQQHVMWYEIGILKECLDSISNALRHSKFRVRFKFCLNAQTHLETPTTGINPIKLFDDSILSHPIIKYSEVVWKTDEDPIFGIGDWRREIYDADAKYTVWGETDCLLPFDFFHIIENFSNASNPHILSFASRKMWDDEWNMVEHVELRKYTHRNNTIRFLPQKMFCADVLNQEELDSFNQMFPTIDIDKNSTHRIDGALLCLSGGFLEKFIPDDMHFVREDTCLQEYCGIRRIPQYCVTTRIKGHNYFHPNKRTFTNSNRSDKKYLTAEKESVAAMENFVKKLITEPFPKYKHE